MSVLLCVLSLLLSHCSLSVSTNVSNAAETHSKQATPALVMSSSLGMLFLHLHLILKLQRSFRQSLMHVVYMCKQSTCASNVCQGLSLKPHGMSHEQLNLASCHAVTGRWGCDSLHPISGHFKDFTCCCCCCCHHCCSACH